MLCGFPSGNHSSPVLVCTASVCTRVHVRFADKQNDVSVRQVKRKKTRVYHRRPGISRQFQCGLKLALCAINRGRQIVSSTCGSFVPFPFFLCHFHIFLSSSLFLQSLPLFFLVSFISLHPSAVFLSLFSSLISLFFP